MFWGPKSLDHHKIFWQKNRLLLSIDCHVNCQTTRCDAGSRKPAAADAQCTRSRATCSDVRAWHASPCGAGLRNDPHRCVAGKIMAGIDPDRLLNDSAQLLRHSTRATLCRMCKTKERKGPLKIDGAYAWPVVQRAFEGFGEWDITCKPGWTIHTISVREQTKLSKSLAFEVGA